LTDIVEAPSCLEASMRSGADQSLVDIDVPE
jgi:hypothetical protein